MIPTTPLPFLHSKLFATPLLALRSSRGTVGLSGKERTVASASRAASVPASSHASVLGYRSNYRQMET